MFNKLTITNVLISLLGFLELFSLPTSLRVHQHYRLEEKDMDPLRSIIHKAADMHQIQPTNPYQAFPWTFYSICSLLCNICNDCAIATSSLRGTLIFLLEALKLKMYPLRDFVFCRTHTIFKKTPMKG